MYLKTAIVLAWWLGTYLLILFGGFPWFINVVLCVVWALAIAGVGFCVMHDANHGAYSSHPSVNRLMGLTAELLGISGFRWRIKHNVWHHTFTNIRGFDDDVQAYGTMRLTPHEPWKPWYRYQVYYFPLVYCLIGLDFILRDFLMVSPRTSGVRAYPSMTAIDQIAFWLGKVLFFLMMFGFPLLVFEWSQVLAGFLIVIMVLGFTMGLVFQLAHIMDSASFPKPTGQPLQVENAWAIHEVETTINFAPNNRLLGWYIGGLNFQIEHHLLPRICHLNYPRIAPIVKQTCREFGVRYTSYDTWLGAHLAHVLTLTRLGQPPTPA
jgi:linoleoyl-CoA desaturase